MEKPGASSVTKKEKPKTEVKKTEPKKDSPSSASDKKERQEKGREKEKDHRKERHEFRREKSKDKSEGRKDYRKEQTPPRFQGKKLLSKSKRLEESRDDGDVPCREGSRDSSWDGGSLDETESNGKSQSHSKFKILVRSHAVRDASSPPPVPDLPLLSSLNTSSDGTATATLKHQLSGDNPPVHSAHQIHLSGDATPKSEPALSRESSQEKEYTDFTGVDVHEFIVQTLQNSRDRMMLLKLEQDLMNFVQDQSQHTLKFPPMTSYHRMIVHRVGAYFGMDHNIDQTGKAVVINKTQNTRIPEQRFKEHIRHESRPEEPRMILKRDSASLDDKEGKSSDQGGLKEDKRSKSIEEREEEYEKARARIFNQDSISSQEGTGSNLSIESPLRSSQSTRTSSRRSSNSEECYGWRPEPRPWSSVDSSGSERPSVPAVTKASSFAGTGISSVLMRGDSSSSSRSSGSRGSSGSFSKLTKLDSSERSAGSPSFRPLPVIQQQPSISAPAPPPPPPPPPQASQPYGQLLQQSTYQSSQPVSQVTWTSAQTVSMATGVSSSNAVPQSGPVLYAAPNIESVPAGSILINPATGTPYLNPDGTPVVYQPGPPVSSQVPVQSPTQQMPQQTSMPTYSQYSPPQQQQQQQQQISSMLAAQMQRSFSGESQGSGMPDLASQMHSMSLSRESSAEGSGDLVSQQQQVMTQQPYMAASYVRPSPGGVMTSAYNTPHQQQMMPQQPYMQPSPQTMYSVPQGQMMMQQPVYRPATPTQYLQQQPTQPQGTQPMQQQQHLSPQQLMQQPGMPVLYPGQGQSQGQQMVSPTQPYPPASQYGHTYPGMPMMQQQQHPAMMPQPSYESTQQQAAAAAAHAAAAAAAQQQQQQHQQQHQHQQQQQQAGSQQPAQVPMPVYYQPMQPNSAAQMMAGFPHVPQDSNMTRPVTPPQAVGNQHQPGFGYVYAQPRAQSPQGVMKLPFPSNMSTTPPQPQPQQQQQPPSGLSLHQRKYYPVDQRPPKSTELYNPEIHMGKMAGGDHQHSPGGSPIQSPSPGIIPQTTLRSNQQQGKGPRQPHLMQQSKGKIPKAPKKLRKGQPLDSTALQEICTPESTGNTIEIYNIPEGATRRDAQTLFADLVKAGGEIQWIPKDGTVEEKLSEENPDEKLAGYNIVAIFECADAAQKALGSLHTNAKFALRFTDRQFEYGGTSSSCLST